MARNYSEIADNIADTVKRSGVTALTDDQRLVVLGAIIPYLEQAEQSQPVPEVGAMADALGDALRRKHAVFLARTKLEDLVRAMLESAPKPGADNE